MSGYCGATQAENKYQDNWKDLPSSISEEDQGIALEIAGKLINDPDLINFLGMADNIGLHDEIRDLVISKFEQQAIELKSDREDREQAA
ncbi:MAG: hypothetical protein ACRBCS_02970 [Cellvibrionaceae bacterium]